MTPLFPLIQSYSFHCPPDWRWRRARWLVEHGRYVTRKRDDGPTARAVGYLRAVARSRSQVVAARLDPDLDAARRLHEVGGNTRLLIEALVLARQSPSGVAALAGVPESVVVTYEAQFFDCRLRLDYRDWITLRAVGRRYHGATASDPGTVLKGFAYHGGMAALQAVLPHLFPGLATELGIDLASADERLDRSARLAVAAALVPEGLDWDLRLTKIRPLLPETGRKPASRYGPPALLAREIDVRLHELPSSPPVEATPECDVRSAGGHLRAA